jgi:hypothetical protein
MQVTNRDIDHGWGALLAVAFALLPISILSVVVLVLHIGVGL